MVSKFIYLQLGAFLAGALLAETNYRTQIEADIRPFRGLLLGLFFVTTGTSIDTQVLDIFWHCVGKSLVTFTGVFYDSCFFYAQHCFDALSFLKNLIFGSFSTPLYIFTCFVQLLMREWPNVISLLAGLIVIKTLIITALGPRVGLTLQESIRIGLLLSQGGEFAFVVFSLANR